jgi:prefoldin subunit 5
MSNTPEDIAKEIDRLQRNISALHAHMMRCKPQYIQDYADNIREAEATLATLKASIQ